MPLLQEIVGFESPDVVRLYVQRFGLSEARAKALFIDVKRFLFIRGLSPLGLGFAPTQRIEEAWHVFFECSDVYERFCRLAFGYSIPPLPKGSSQTRLQAMRRSVAAARILFGDCLSENWRVE